VAERRARAPARGGSAKEPRFSSPDGARTAALDLLARRAHFRNELEKKLLAKGWEADDVRAALDRLERAKLLDDRRSAAEFLQSRLRRAPQGRRRLRAELERKGLDSELIDHALAVALPESETDLARAAARRFQRRRRSADPRALARHLDRLGFSVRDILTVAEEATDLQPPDDD
jgi:regulatory protein